MTQFANPHWFREAARTLILHAQSEALVGFQREREKDTLETGNCRGGDECSDLFAPGQYVCFGIWAQDRWTARY